MKRLDKHGREILDPRPVAIPTGFKEPESMEARIQRLIRTSLSRAAQQEGMETFEESEDFDIEDDPSDPQTAFETFFDPILGKDLTYDEFRRNEAVYKQQLVVRELEEARQRDIQEAREKALQEAKGRRRRRRQPDEEPPAPPAPPAKPAHST